MMASAREGVLSPSSGRPKVAFAVVTTPILFPISKRSSTTENDIDEVMLRAVMSEGTRRSCCNLHTSIVGCTFVLRRW